MTYNPVIVGAGHNGLVCAAYLARAGHRDVIGVGYITDEFVLVYHFSTGSLVASLFRQEIIQDLDLAGHGSEIIPREPSVVGLFPDGRSLALGSDPAACAAEIAKFSVQDSKAYTSTARQCTGSPSSSSRTRWALRACLCPTTRTRSRPRSPQPPAFPTRTSSG